MTDGEFGNENDEYRNEDVDMVYTTDRLNPTVTKSLEVTDTLGERCKWSLIRNGEQSFARE